jgi:hypothetical protein
MTDMTSISATSKPSSNAKVSSIALVIGSVALLALATQLHSLTPLRLLTLGIITFGIWAFCDEMEMRKPLIRAGFITFVTGIIARFVALIETHSSSLGQYYLLYAFCLLIAIFLWSVAYLHRQRNLKFAGALGVVASVAPIVAIVTAHIALGASTVFGISSLLAATEGAAMKDFSFINTIDSIFALWSLVTARFLWQGYIQK